LRVAVLGASGGMGSFFVRYFAAKGDSVSGSDVREPGESPKGFTFHRRNADAARGSDVTIIATPMDRMLEVAAEVAGSLKEGSVVLDVSSVKGESYSKLRKAVGGARVLSIHPLFGPALESTKGMKIAVITGKEGGEEELAKRLFPDARIIPMTRKEHDKTMAVVLSLTHMLNLAYAKTVLEFLTPEEFMRVSTPNSSMQLALAEAVLAQDPRLSYSIQTGDAYTGRVAKRAARELRRVTSMVEGSDEAAFEEYFRGLAKAYKTGKRSRAAIREIYSAAEKS
jgi:prephenate dehydrogenase